MLEKLLLLCLTFTILQANDIKKLNVGIYQNKPKIFLNNQHQPSGFFIDILNEMAKEEKWNLNYIPCVWSECLIMLKNGELDIMPDVGYSIERSNRFLFSNEVVLSTWSHLYKAKDVDIESILDLENKKIVVLRDSIQSDSIKTILYEYGLTPHSYIEVDEWAEAFKLISLAKADALAINRFYELSNEIDDSIVKTKIVLMPAMIKFGFSHTNTDIRDRVDFYIKKYKNDKQSIFYQSEKKWMKPIESQKVPKWIVITLLGSIVLILFLLLLIYIFRKMVISKSQDIIQKEKTILVQSRHASMGEMIGMIVHQWRQPLSILAMGAHSLTVSVELKKDIEVELRAYLDTVLLEVEHLSNTVDDFRDFFNPNRKMIEQPISSIVDNVKKIFGNSLENSNINFIVDIENDYLIRTYSSDLLQVLLILINNAKDILYERTVENAEIVLHAYETQDSYNITVCDNAGGIPEHLLDKIGEQYFTTKEESNGTGLGIYMSKNILEQHLDGTLSWKNVSQQACFSISIKK